MFLRALGIVSAAILAISVALGVVVFTLSDPSTASLDQELASVRTDLAAATEQSAKYTDGLIKSLIIIRIETLRVTETMLNAKRISVLRRIQLRFNVDGHEVTPASASDLSRIDDEIKQVLRRVADVEIRSREYRGGLVQAMALATAETERLSLAQLRMAYYAAKYGLAAPRAGPALNQVRPNLFTPGTVVKDKDAL